MIIIKELSNDKEKGLLTHFLQHNQQSEYYQAIKDNHYMLVLDNDQLIGYAIFQIKNDVLHINDLYIIPDQRGQGFGDGLIRATLNLANQQAIVWAFINNQLRYQAFHERVGLKLFDKVEHIPEFVKFYRQNHGDHHDLLINIPQFFQGKCKSNRYI